MAYLITKTLISALLITVVSEISKRSSLFGAILASLPLVSFLGMIWLYIDTNSVEKVAELSHSIFWMVIPSLSLFIILPILLKKYNFYLALSVSTTIMILFYFLMVRILNYIGITL